MQNPLLPLSYPSSESVGKAYTNTDSSYESACGTPEDLSVIFNTAFVRSRAPVPQRDLAAELADLSKSPAYEAIVHAAQQLARSQNVSELEAAEQIIATFRKMDEVWGAYLTQEGLARITS